MIDLNPETAIWVRSSYSGNGGQCVECAPGYAARIGVVPVRDSKNPETALAFPTNGWSSFVSTVKGGTLPIA
jgi:hypothetical protein